MDIATRFKAWGFSGLGFQGLMFDPLIRLSHVSLQEDSCLGASQTRQKRTLEGHYEETQGFLKGSVLSRELPRPKQPTRFCHNRIIGNPRNVKCTYTATKLWVRSEHSVAASGGRCPKA